MKILVVAPCYPHAGNPFGGVFNERCALALQQLCDGVEVLVPKPFAPPALSSLVPRWKLYSHMPAYEQKNGVPVYRPSILQIPRVGGAFCVDKGAFLGCRRLVANMHRRMQFDAILSFDLAGAGGLAWRLGELLGVPASGWGTGGDVRFPQSSTFGRSVIRALRNLDLVFYQSHETLKKAALLLGQSPDRMPRERHTVLPRGVPAPPSLNRAKTRTRVRDELGITGDQVLVLSIGRICRAKGILELSAAMSLARARDPRITCVAIGSLPVLDETENLVLAMNQSADLRGQLRVLPACSPNKVWEYLCAADIFAFASHHEGMPNSLLEAMAMGLPAVAFAIPAVQEIEAGSGGIALVPPLDSTLFSESVLRLAASPEQRRQIGERGKNLVAERFMVRNNMAEAVRRLSQIVQHSAKSNCKHPPLVAPCVAGHGAPVIEQE